MKSTFLQPPLDIRLACTRFEIGFWHLAIDLLSDSRLLQRLVASLGKITLQMMPYLQEMDRHRAARWAAAGLGIGFFSAILGAILNW